MNALRLSMTASAKTEAADRGGSWRRAVKMAGMAMATAVERLGRFHRKRRAMAHIRSLPNHALKDIGIDRSEIASVVHGLGRDRSRRNRTD